MLEFQDQNNKHTEPETNNTCFSHNNVDAHQNFSCLSFLHQLLQMSHSKEKKRLVRNKDFLSIKMLRREIFILIQFPPECGNNSPHSSDNLV